MIDLTVVIVSYNVAFFLDQCLKSVFLSGRNLNMEAIVVDNNSVDNTLEMLQAKYPNVQVIANQSNLGFSKANNQAIAKARGRYILLLNPDTIVEDETLADVVEFMDQHPDAGGLGVKMYDGNGRYLPESKRGLPTPSVAFYKITGLSKLFPKSRIFGKYHLGYLDPDQTHKVDVLAGAFMLLRKETLTKTGLLDERFFMYGEDIDLSYRITKAGYYNYYFPKARIIHYKGESTKKGSLNYVYLFYKAMMLFARKHFSGPNSWMLLSGIQLAVFFRAAVAVLSRGLRQIAFPLVDAAVIFAGFWLITLSWESVRFAPHHFPPEFFFIVLPAYIGIWLVAVYFSGGYDHPAKAYRVFRGVVIGTGIILVIYALLPTHMRFSRALILLGGAWTLTALLLTRYWAVMIPSSRQVLFRGPSRRLAIVGKGTEAGRIVDLLRKAGNTAFIGLITPDENKPEEKGYIGHLRQIDELINVYHIDEVIFCAADIGSQAIINQMARLQGYRVKFKIAPPESLFIIGSNSIDTFEEGYAIHLSPVNSHRNRRNKRVFDILLSLFLIATCPVSVFIIKNRKGLVKNIVQVLLGKKTWVGYVPGVRSQVLPYLKQGVLSPADSLKGALHKQETCENLNNLYAREYRIENDFNIVITAFSKLGRQENL